MELKEYTTHLYNDTIVGTKEYQLKQLSDILGLMAQCKDRINSRLDDCKNLYGYEDGKVKGTPQDIDYIQVKRKVINRLKIYYNNKLTNINPFKI